MNILQVNDNNLPGRRFNGYDLNCELRRFGHVVEQIVFVKQSSDVAVSFLSNDLAVRNKIINLEQKYSLHDILFPYGKLLMEKSCFQSSDIVHYHLIHNNMLSLFDLPDMTRAKPSVWTWHDPWAVTGHCVHPKDCEGWKTGCSPCPHLDEYFPLRKDKAGLLWSIKMDVYRKMDVDIVVSSDFMLDFAKNSPLGQCFERVHKIPFGIQTDIFGIHDRETARLALGIPADSFVIAFRCESNPYKGTEYIYSALEYFENRKDIVLLCIGSASLPQTVEDHFHAVHLGWQNDQEVLSDFYSACDLFLMPSIAESFGLMAVEAMASERPVICFEGTALPSVINVPQCGISVPKGDARALYEAILRLKEHPAEREIRGQQCKKLVRERYRFEDYVRRHEELYQEIIERKNHTV